jgi:hypothetical protein
MTSLKSKKKKSKKLVRKFKSNLLKNGLPDNMRLRKAPRGQEKMSDVISRFVEPYAEHATTEEDYRRLYSVASVAWNAAVLSEAMPGLYESLIDECIPATEKEARMAINELVHRKKKYFAKYSRIIVHHDVNMIEDSVHVVVTSTPTK